MTDKQWPDKTVDISGLRREGEATLRPGEVDDPTRVVPAANPFQPGVAQVGGERTLTNLDLTATDVVGSAIQSRGALKQPAVPLRSRVRQLRKGGRWSAVGAGILVFCWSLWAISGRDLGVSTLALLVTLAVGAFLFALSRLLGFVVLERTFRRVRRSALASHVITGAFFTVVGVLYLRRVQWIIDAWDWIRGVG